MQFMKIWYYQLINNPTVANHMSNLKNKSFLSVNRRHALQLLTASAGFGAAIMLPKSLRAATSQDSTQLDSTAQLTTQKSQRLVTVGALSSFEVIPGNQAQVESILEGNLALVENEPGTVQWYSFNVSPTSYGFFGVFPDEKSRQAYLNGKFLAFLLPKLRGLITANVKTELVDIISSTIVEKKSPQKLRLKANFGVRPRFEVQPSKVNVLESLLRIGVYLTREEPATREWFSFKFGPTTYGIFDVFQDLAGRQAHFDGPFTAILFATLDAVQSSPPIVDLTNILSATINDNTVNTFADQ